MIELFIDSFAAVLYNVRGLTNPNARKSKSLLDWPQMRPAERTVSRVKLKSLFAYLLNHSLPMMKSSGCSKDTPGSDFSFGAYIKAPSNGIMWTGSMKPDEELAHIVAEDVAVTYMTEMMSDDGPRREVLHVA